MHRLRLLAMESERLDVFAGHFASCQGTQHTWSCHVQTPDRCIPRTFYTCCASKECIHLLQVLFEDKQLQQTIFNKHRDELRSLDEKINEIRVSSSAGLCKIV